MLIDINKNRNKSGGFSLVEMLMVLVIIGIIMAAGAPTFDSMVRRNGLATQTNILIAALASARTYAVSHKRSVVVERLNGSWNQGFLIKPGDIGGEIISELPLDTDLNITVTGNVPFTFVEFDRLGRLTPVTFTPNISSFVVCDTTQGLGNVIQMSIFGSPTVANNVPC